MQSLRGGNGGAEGGGGLSSISNSGSKRLLTSPLLPSRGEADGEAEGEPEGEPEGELEGEPGRDI